MEVLYRQRQEEQERGLLSPLASLSGESKGRTRSSTTDILRNDFQRDRDRILHTKAFRRLSHKTQVFLAAEGDHFRTRLTHTLEVSQIARSIARALCLNEDLAEAIALGHDLGHTPFGHTGEEAISRCLARHRGFDSASTQEDLLFKHGEQSLRIVDLIENNGLGLNLTAEVRDGIACHSGTGRAATLEGRIVALADRIAYVNHDIDDAIRAGILKECDLPSETCGVLGAGHSARIETLVLDTVTASAIAEDIRMSEEVWSAMMGLRSFLYERVYRAPVVVAEVRKAMHLLNDLFDYYVDHIDEVPAEYRALSQGDDLRAVADYVAGMTDRYAKNLYSTLFIPKSTYY